MTNVEVDQILYRYGDYPAVDCVTFALRAGELAMLIGRNGSGKSTLLRCIAGWLEPAQGQIKLCGKTLRSLRGSVNNYLVFVPDTPPAYANLTVWEHLQLVGQVNRIQDWKSNATGLLDRFDLSSYGKAMPAALSRGQRYKLALCAAFLMDAEVLLLDEPFGPLDPLSVRALWQDLAEICAHGKTVLVSNHHAVSEMLPDRYLVLDGGQLIADGSPDTLQRKFQTASNELDALLQAALLDEKPTGGKS